ncbi:MAG: lytic transglycosylase domain-containing protein [Actinobacteria bacterium]|nr:lytic transglycosylase domain-containing protein [Actinomycetota bacterium]
MINKKYILLYILAIIFFFCCSILFIFNNVEDNNELIEKIDSLNIEIDNLKNKFYEIKIIDNKIKAIAWRIDSDRSRKLSEAIWLYSNVYDLNSDLLISLVFVESGFRKFSKSSVGCLGYFQINPYVHDINWNRIYDEYYNTSLGCKILRDNIDRIGNLKLALNAYNGWCSYDNQYANIVLNHKKKIERI